MLKRNLECFRYMDKNIIRLKPKLISHIIKYSVYIFRALTLDKMVQIMFIQKSAIRKTTMNIKC